MDQHLKRLDDRSPSASRGQLYTLEAVIGLLIIGGVIVLLGSGLTIPLASEAPEERAADAAVQEAIETTLQQSQADGSLQAAVLGWSPGADSFIDEALTPTSDGGYFVLTPENTFGTRLQAIQAEYNVSMNIRLVPAETDTDPARGGESKDGGMYYLRSGVPPQHVVTASAEITLYGSDRLRSSNQAHSHRVPPVVAGSGGGDRLRNLADDEYPLPERPGGSGAVYNTVRIEVVVWYE